MFGRSGRPAGGERFEALEKRVDALEVENSAKHVHCDRCQNEIEELKKQLKVPHDCSDDDRHCGDCQRSTSNGGDCDRYAWTARTCPAFKE